MIGVHAEKGEAWHVITFDPRDIVALAKAMNRAGREVDGYAAEATLIRILGEVR